MLGKKTYNNLLEAGTGSGIFSPELFKHCEHLYVCDVHDDFDNIALLCDTHKIHSYNPGSQSIDNANFRDQSFGAVVAVSFLEFVSDIQNAITEIKRILKKKGFYITICPMESKTLDFFLNFYTRKPPKEESGDARQKVAKILEQNFTIVKKGYMIPLIGKFFPIYTHYKLKKY